MFLFGQKDKAVTREDQQLWCKCNHGHGHVKNTQLCIIVYTLGQKDKVTREAQQQMKAVVMQMLSVTTQRKAALVS